MLGTVADHVSWKDELLVIRLLDLQHSSAVLQYLFNGITLLLISMQSCPALYS